MTEALDDTVTSPVEMRSGGVQVDNVDFGERIITVLAVPYEQPTAVFFRSALWQEVFSRGAFSGIEGEPSFRRIPALADLRLSTGHNHDGGRLIGKIVSADPYRESGLVCDIKVAKTEVGDEALELARDDAISASVGFTVKNQGEQLDRYAKTRRINKAGLHHLALVGEPSYEGAKVLSMRSDGRLMAEEGSPLIATPTPRMDEFLNDPILQWASKAAQNPSGS